MKGWLVNHKRRKQICLKIFSTINIGLSSVLSCPSWFCFLLNVSFSPLSGHSQVNICNDPDRWSWMVQVPGFLFMSQADSLARNNEGVQFFTLLLIWKSRKNYNVLYVWTRVFEGQQSWFQFFGENDCLEDKRKKQNKKTNDPKQKFSKSRK